MAAARATLIRVGDLREQYLDLLELVEERTLHDPQPWPSLEKLYGKYGYYVYFTETQWDFTATEVPRCLVAIVERMLDNHCQSLVRTLSNSCTNTVKLSNVSKLRSLARKSNS